MQIWNPRFNGDYVEGKFIGFAEFNFREGETTWLPVVMTERMMDFALPNNFSIINAFRNAIEKLNADTNIRVEYLNEVEFDNGKTMRHFIVYINGQEVPEHRIISAEQFAQLLNIS